MSTVKLSPAESGTGRINLEILIELMSTTKLVKGVAESFAWY